MLLRMTSSRRSRLPSPRAATREFVRSNECGRNSERGAMSCDRERLRQTFDGSALLYDRVRPGYPEALFDDVIARSGIDPCGRVLEIGCGTGQATLPFARRGYRVICVELGESLAAVAQHNLAPFPLVEVQTGS